MCWKVIEVIAAVFTAIGTVSVGVLAIWGDFFRYKLAVTDVFLLFVSRYAIVVFPSRV